jgi:peptide/nickel transport system substrate-binding protein
MKNFLKFTTALALLSPLPAFAQKTLTAVMHAELKVLDPIWSTAFITRTHGYMIYDTLFALDEKGLVQPQMVDKYTVSADNLLYTFTLRDGLKWHDGPDVTTADVIPSIQRWAAKDAVGQKIMPSVEVMTAVDAKTFTIKLKEPNSLLLFGLGKAASNAPFIMPKRVAETDPNKQIDDYTGSGPYIFKKDEWKPGDKIVYAKNTAYVPRKEPGSALAGGKVVHFDTVIWKVMGDQQQAINAASRGEVDVVEQPPIDLLPLAKADKNLKVVNYYPPGLQYTFRFNSLHKPFDNPKIKQALLYAFSQEDFLKGMVGDPDYYKTCLALFGCGQLYESTAGMEGGILEGNVNKARALLQEAGYDGTPVVLLHSTDLAVLTNLAPIAKQAMEKVGFKVDMQSSDWGTIIGRRAKKDAPSAGGWNGMLTAWGAADVYSPATMAFLNSACEKALFGWPCDAEMEKLRDAFVKENDLTKQKAIVDQIQKRWRENPSHVHLGQFVQPSVVGKNIEGVKFSPFFPFWNITKN